jgi:hypothetical protein
MILRHIKERVIMLVAENNDAVVQTEFHRQFRVFEYFGAAENAP